VELIGSVEGANIIFATTALGVYAIDLKLLRSRKLCEGQAIRPFFPFMSFYYPGIVAVILDLQRLARRAFAT
jgi:hypothetical protein